MRTNDLEHAIDTGDVDAVRAIVTAEPELVRCEIAWERGLWRRLV